MTLLSLLTSFDFWVVILIAGLLMLVGSATLRFFGVNLGKNPKIDAIYQALLPLIYQAILAGEKSALWAFQTADVALSGTDKAQVANSLYALLPDTLIISGIPMPIAVVKTLVSRELFARWVKDAYDSAHAFILRNEDYLHSQSDQLKTVQALK